MRGKLNNERLKIECKMHLVHAARAAPSGVAGGDHVTYPLVHASADSRDLRPLSHHGLRDVDPPVSARHPIGIAAAAVGTLMLRSQRRRLCLVREMGRGALEPARPPCPRGTHRAVVVAR